MILRERTDQVSHLEDLLRVKTDGRLVEDHDLGISHQSLRDTDALLIALGKVADQSALHVTELDNGHDLVKMRDTLQGTALQLIYEIQILLHCHIGIKRRLLGQIADHALCFDRILSDIHAADRCRTGGSRQKARQNIHRRTLARAVRSKKTDDLALADFKRNVVQRIVRAVALHQILNFYHNF